MGFRGLVYISPNFLTMYNQLGPILYRCVGPWYNEAEAIRTTVVPITNIISTTVVRIASVIRTTKNIV